MSKAEFLNRALKSLSTKKYPDLWIGLVMILSSFPVFYAFRDNMHLIYRHWDGPLYMYIAKVWYNIPMDHPFQPWLPPIYFASHLPGYPFLIRLMTIFTGGDYAIAMILATQVSAITSAILFYRLLIAANVVVNPLWTAMLYCFFPARWLILHTIGATEPLFLCFVFGSLLAYYRKQTALLVLCIIMASITRITGVLLLPVFGILFALERRWKEIAILPAGLLGILGVFVAYHFCFNDFFAYFRWNAEQQGLIRFPPFEVYRFYTTKINAHSTSLYYILFVLFGLGTVALSKFRPIFVYCLVNYIFSCFIYHFDLNRYLVPMAAFCLLLPLDHLLNRKAFRLILFPLFLYMTYAFAIGWIPFPLMRIDKFEAFIKFMSAGL